jgi:hypothetical protein
VFPVSSSAVGSSGLCQSSLLLDSIVFERTSLFLFSRIGEKDAISVHFAETLSYHFSRYLESEGLPASRVLISDIAIGRSSSIQISNRFLDSALCSASVDPHYSNAIDVTPVLDSVRIGESLRYRETVTFDRSLAKCSTLAFYVSRSISSSLTVEGTTAFGRTVSGFATNGHKESLFVRQTTKHEFSIGLGGSSSFFPSRQFSQTLIRVNSGLLRDSKTVTASARHFQSASRIKSAVLNSVSLRSSKQFTSSDRIASTRIVFATITFDHSSVDSSSIFSETAVFTQSSFLRVDIANAKDGTTTSVQTWLGATLGAVAALVIALVFILLIVKRRGDGDTNEDSGGSCEITESMSEDFMSSLNGFEVAEEEKDSWDIQKGQDSQRQGINHAGPRA